MEIIRYTDQGAKEKILDFLKREQLDPDVEKDVSAIVEKVALFGDNAVSEYTRALDNVAIAPGQSKVRQEEFREAAAQVHASFRKSFDQAKTNIARYYAR